MQVEDSGKLSATSLKLFTFPRKLAAKPLHCASIMVSVGKVEAMNLYLPVVAMGSIPHIYQRAGLALGYPETIAT